MNKFMLLQVYYSVQHQQTKHIEINIHFVRDFVASGQVRVILVFSRFQYADINPFGENCISWLHSGSAQLAGGAHRIFSSLVSQSARFSLVATAPNPDLGKDEDNNKQVANPVLKKSWAILLRIGQALRAVASMSRQDWAKKLVQLKTEFADTLKHYWLGIMLLGVDVKIVSRLLGASLSRTDRQQLTKLLGTVPRCQELGVVMFGGNGTSSCSSCPFALRILTQLGQRVVLIDCE
ncbi:hypothetical protein Tco_0943666 [Tanacetum coccineum]